MATQQMQMPQTTGGAPAFKRTSVIVAVTAALAVGALIGRETAQTTRTGVAVPGATVRPAIVLNGTDSADAARRADVYQAMAGLDAGIALTGTNSADAARRVEVFEAIGKLDVPATSTSRLTDAERQALIARRVSLDEGTT